MSSGGQTGGGCYQKCQRQNWANGDFFRKQSFGDIWLDAQISTLKSLMVQMVSGERIPADDFSLVTDDRVIPERTDEELMHLGKVYREE